MPSCYPQDTINEAKVLAQFNHVNIVHYHGLVLEVVGGGGWSQCAGSCGTPGAQGAHGPTEDRARPDLRRGTDIFNTRMFLVEG